MRVPLTDMLTWIRKHWPDVMLRLLETFSGAPLVSSIADLRTIWKRVLDPTERAGARIVRTVVDQVFGRLL
jgi:hypothetical protein